MSRRAQIYYPRQSLSDERLSLVLLKKVVEFYDL
jgi:hypothetical protein